MQLPEPDKKSDRSPYNLKPADLIKRPILLKLSLIALVCAGLCGSLACAAGLFEPAKLTQDKVVDRLEAASGVHPGFRRNHAKGVCASGYFTGSGDVESLSRADVFRAVKTPVIGRFALAGPNPFQADKTAQVRSMALSFSLPGGEVWRTGMNNIPVFTVRNVDGFYDLLKASKPDPATGKPDPDTMSAFFVKYPESAASIPKIQSRDISSGFANATYNALNTFYLVNRTGQQSPIRWSMVPADAATSAGQQDVDNTNVLFDDLVSRFDQGPVAWTMVASLADPEDPLNDATQAWPDSRRKITLGTLTLTAIEDEDHGACGDINFDPLLLPDGIIPSADPLLSARSAAYSSSFTRRQNEDKAASAVSVSTKPATAE